MAFFSSAPDSAVELMMHYVSKEIQTEDASIGAYIPIVKGADAALENPSYSKLQKV